MVLEEASAAFMVADGAASLEAAVFEELEGPAERTSRELEPEAPTPSVAPLPTGDVPTGYIWPAHTGRAMLRALSLQANVTVGPKRVHHVAAEHVLTTSLEERFTDPEAARQALVRAARERTQLESLLVPETVLVVQPAPDGASWLWMVTPRLEHIPDWVAGSPLVRTDQLGSAIAEGVCVSLRHELAFAPAVDAFGVQSGSVRYIGPLRTSTHPSRSALDLLTGMLAQLAAHDVDGHQLVAAVTRRLEVKLRADEMALLADECARLGDAVAPSTHGLLLRALRASRRRRESIDASSTSTEPSAAP